MIAERIIRRKSLGRTASIGSLYNAIIDTFYETKILKTKFPNDFIKRTDIPHTELLHEYENSYMEKFNKLDVEPELKLSVLSGLLSLEGSGKYLSDVKESQRCVKGTLICKMTTVEENLNIDRDDIKECTSTEELNNTDATHVVIGIKWGSVIMASFVCNNTKEENRSQIEVALKSYFKKIKLPNSEEGDINIDVEEEQSNIMSNFSIKLFGDVIPHNEEILDFDEAKKVIAKLPLYIKQSNDGKGVPIEYILYPLSELVNLFSQNITFNSMIMELSQETILRTEQVFDSLFESKQRFNALHCDALSICNFITDEIVSEINNYATEVIIEMEKFKKEISECLVRVRSGKGNINELESKLETFHKSILSKESITIFINQHRSVSTKAILKEKNVEYLDKVNIINYILDMNQDDEIYMLIDSNEYLVDTNLSPVQSAFRDLYNYNSDEKSSKFFIANPKTCTGIEDLDNPVIHHYKNGKPVTYDYYKDNEVIFTSNIIKFDSEQCNKSNNTTSKKIQLLIRCPQANCPSICRNWKCFRCKQNIEYGYNKCIYCGCGENKIAKCKFKCNSSNHIEGYIAFETNTLINLLPSKSPKEINILLLGKSGVGKSTFINSFVNYLKFDKLDDAKSGNIEVLIPSKFTIPDENYNVRTIEIGDNKDSGEQLDNISMSATQECKSYVIHATGNKLIRLIDTPGIADTRGLDQNEKNLDNILWYISHYKNLNGICILLKSNDSRLDTVFRFCIQELLSYLHKNAKNNIVFCFTNTRGACYNPGDTLLTLKNLLEEFKEQSSVEIKVEKDTMYCFDSETFRFLAATKKGIQFAEQHEQSFSGSWNHSAEETQRLINYLVACPAHKVKDTLSLNNSRNIVTQLAKPLAEIGQLIQTNIKLNKMKQKELETSEQTLEELIKNKLFIQQVDLEPIRLKRPRTVCTSDGCIELKNNGNVEQINYKTHCDPNCYLPFVKSNVINNKVLMLCGAMGWNGLCKHCHCHWNKHMRITYENTQIIKKISNPDIEILISEKISDQVIIENFIETYERKVDELEKEQQKINEISFKFAQFLRQNAIAPFNDAYIDYLDLFIREEKIKKSVDPNHYDNVILEGLETTKRIYLEQIEIIKQAIENNDSSKPPILPEEITNLEQQLYTLQFNGKTLKKIKDVAENSQINTFTYKESHYMPLENGIKVKGSLWKKLLLFANSYMK